MITQDKLDIYQRYAGDIDGLAKGKASDREAVTDQEWREIEELIQRLSLEKAGLVSSKYRMDTSTLLEERIDSPMTLQRPMQMTR